MISTAVTPGAVATAQQYNNLRQDVVDVTSAVSAMGPESTQTLKNKTISGAFNTLTNIGEASLLLSDVTTGNATSARHGFLPKLTNTGSRFLRDDGSWQTIIQGLNYFQEALNTTAPNDVVGVNSLTLIGTTIDIDFAVVPRMAGAFLLSIPDGEASGGNKRGQNAVDLQMVRNDATQVASGNQSTVIGARNTASGQYSIAMGFQNTSSFYAAVALGNDNTAGSSRTVAIGSANSALGYYSVAIGAGNQSQSYGEVSLGLFATVGAGNNGVYVATDRLLSIGNGTSDSARSNAMTMLKNGNTTFAGTITAPSFNGVALSTASGAGYYLAGDGTYKLFSVSPTSVQATYQAGENITAGNAVYVAADGKVYKTDADDTSKQQFIGFANESVTSGSNVKINTSGVDTHQSGLTIGAMYYLSSTTGAISNAPSASALIFVGRAVSSTAIEIFNAGYEYGAYTVTPSDSLLYGVGQWKELSTPYVPMAKVSQVTIKVSGTYVVKFTLRAVGGSNYGGIQGRIYKNGVAFGTAHPTLSGYDLTQTYTESLTFSAGDTCELWLVKQDTYNYTEYGGNLQVCGTILPKILQSSIVNY